MGITNVTKSVTLTKHLKYTAPGILRVYTEYVANVLRTSRMHTECTVMANELSKTHTGNCGCIARAVHL